MCFHSAQWTARPETSPFPGTPPPLSTLTPSSLSGISWHRFQEDTSPPDSRLRGKCRMSMYVLCYWVGKNNVMFLSTQGVWPFCSDQRLTDDSPILCDEVCQDSSVHHTFSSGFVWGAFEFYKEILHGFVQNAKSLTLLLHVYLFQGMAIPALNGVLSAWSLTSEKSRMVTLTYCGKSRAWFIRHNRRKDKPSFISTSYKSDKFESAPTFFSISINRSIFETNSQINSKMLPVLDLYLERLKKK